MDKLFQIGEIAKMFNLSVGSLRHYEQKGLLFPEHIDLQTGYRYYSVRQFEALNTIRYLRMLDMPLKDIGDFLKNRDISTIEEKLQMQKADVIKKQQELKNIEKKIDNRLRQLKIAQTAPLNKIQITKKPACRIVKMNDTLKLNSYLDMEKPIRELEGKQKEATVFFGEGWFGNFKGKAFEGQFFGI